MAGCSARGDDLSEALNSSSSKQAYPLSASLLSAREAIQRERSSNASSVSGSIISSARGSNRERLRRQLQERKSSASGSQVSAAGSQISNIGSRAGSVAGSDVGRATATPSTCSPYVGINGCRAASQKYATEYATARQVDAVVKAIHIQSGDESRICKLSKAYKDLSKGLDMPEPKDLDKPKKYPPALGSPARGAVPCIDGDRPANVPVPLEMPSKSKKTADAAPAPIQSAHTMVPTPWGPERANADKPPHASVKQRRQKYCDLLNTQNAENQVLNKQKHAKEVEINRKTNTSFESQHHRWGLGSSTDPNEERAIFNELLATIDYKAERERSGKQAARQDEERITAAVDKQMAWQWHLKREEDKQEKERMSAEWTAAALEKQRKKEAQKVTKLQEEKDQIKHINDGLVPTRRIRRPKEECMALQEVLTAREAANLER